jgi:hypothetical protein
MASLIEDGSDELMEDLGELIAAGLVAVTGTWPDLRYVVTPEGEQALAEHEGRVRAEARELAERRHVAQWLGIMTEAG